ncbi:hypothetical protein KIM372_00290 [Bombiscardovia nodaiensis]|uniref:Uncharacterized protein n=1 Tax=Bombiscardovia nodaiensis TaxID=2932181 RepID=A0ABM8B5L4_9BIFI|nr:hypothetical protein KIM372_00290 [Bombiscardovia nodaiensis]
MKIRTSADALDIEVVTLEELDPATMEPAKEFGTDDLKKVDGKSVYALRGVAVKVDGRIDKSATIKVLAKPAAKIPELTKARLTGSVVVTPYLADGSRRIGYSVMADGIEVERVKA